MDQLYNLLQQYEVTIPSEDLVLHEDLHERLQEYRVEIDAAQGYRDMKLAEMTTTVESNIVKLQDHGGQAKAAQTDHRRVAQFLFRHVVDPVD